MFLPNCGNLNFKKFKLQNQGGGWKQGGGEFGWGEGEGENADN